MGRFTDSIVGGIGTLIRDYIRSSNYVPGVSGWAIFKDGHAEFQDITARGNITADSLILPAGATTGERIELLGNSITQYDASDNPVLQIASDFSGIIAWGDDFDHDPLIWHRTPGNTFFIIGSTINDTSFLSAQLALQDGAAGGTISLLPAQQASQPFTQTFIGNPAFSGGLLVGQGVNDRDEVQICAGLLGGYYYEDFVLPAIPLAGSTTTNLKATSTNTLHSNYGSAYNFTTGAWTCPVSAQYTIKAEFRCGNATANGRTILALSSGALISGTVYDRDDRSVLSGNPFSSNIDLTRPFNAGDTVFVSAFQSAIPAGTNTLATDTNRLSFERHL